MKRLLALTAVALAAAATGCADNRMRTAACNPCAPAAPACAPCGPVATSVAAPACATCGPAAPDYAPAIGGVQMMPGQVITPTPEVYTPAPQ